MPLTALQLIFVLKVCAMCAYLPVLNVGIHMQSTASGVGSHLPPCLSQGLLLFLHMSGQVTHQCLHILHFQSCNRSTGIIDRRYCNWLYLGSGESVLRFSHCAVRILPTVPSPHPKHFSLFPPVSLLCFVTSSREREHGSRLWPPGLSKAGIILK